ncbi:hypothetical protein SB847_20455, partial [Bacillus sp. SIMBA_026]
LYTWLTSIGLASVFYAYLAALAVLTIIVGFKMKETRGMDLNEDMHQSALPAEQPQPSSAASN